MSSGVRRVRRFSTGRVDIHPQHTYRGRTPMYWWILTSKRWLRGRPINVYVVEHDDGLVVFDTGQDRASVVDPCYFPGGAVGIIYRRLARFSVDPEETFEAGLRGFGYRTSDVGTAVISHLHQDHIGGIAQIPDATLLVAPDEWRSLHRPLAEARGLLGAHIEAPGRRWTQARFVELDDERLRPFTQGQDLFGDGSLVLLPTPGHTPGSMSLLVRARDAAPLLLVGDLTYDVDAFERGIASGVGRASRLRETRRRVLELREQLPGLTFLAAHDPRAAELLSAAYPATGRLTA